jgi:hypothetical protein
MGKEKAKLRLLARKRRKWNTLQVSSATRYLTPADSTDAPDVDDEMEDEDGRFFGGGLNNEQQVSCLSSVRGPADGIANLEYL